MDNKFLEMIEDLQFSTEEQVIAEIEDLDQLDEIIDVNWFTIEELMNINSNPLFRTENGVLYKRGIKSKDWIQISSSLSEKEKNNIVEELETFGGIY